MIKVFVASMTIEWALAIWGGLAGSLPGMVLAMGSMIFLGLIAIITLLEDIAKGLNK